MLLVDSWDKLDGLRPIVLNCILQLFTPTSCPIIAEKEGRSWEKAVVIDIKELGKNPLIKLLFLPGPSGRLTGEYREQGGNQRSPVEQSQRSVSRVPRAKTSVEVWHGNWWQQPSGWGKLQCRQR